MFKHILIVDDSLAARMIIRQYLEIVGCRDAEFAGAANGVEALDKLAVHTFDLILPDMTMPVMDGATFINRLKASPKWNRIPVIIVSSAVNKDNQERFMKFGINYVIGKPVSPQLLHKAIASMNKKVQDI